MNETRKIGVVGPCSSGKSTLLQQLKERGYLAKHIAQEHSYAPTMWERISQPDLLIFLDVSYEVSQSRRCLNWTMTDYEEQHRRLSHARAHAHLYIDTDHLTPEEVFERVVHFLEEQEQASHPE